MYIQGYKIEIEFSTTTENNKCDGISACLRSDINSWELNEQYFINSRNRHNVETTSIVSRVYVLYEELKQLAR